MTALDLSLPMLQQARDRQAAHHYLLADIEAIPHDAEVFDGTEQPGGPVVWRFTRCVERVVSGCTARRRGGVYHLVPGVVAGAASGMAGRR